MVILVPRGEVLMICLVVDEVSTGADVTILPLFLLSQVWPVGEIERVKGGSLVLKFGQGFPCFGPWLPRGLSQRVMFGAIGYGLYMGGVERGFGVIV